MQEPTRQAHVILADSCGCCSYVYIHNFLPSQANYDTSPFDEQTDVTFDAS